MYIRFNENPRFYKLRNEGHWAEVTYYSKGCEAPPSVSP